MKVLNLYAGIGGNRKLWEGVEVTAVENNQDIAEQYSLNFPNDNLVCGDAHQYLLDHYKEFDFIWSSPPCQTHSRMMKATRHDVIKYPSMELYQEIIFLENFFSGNWVVENVIGYYTPLIPPQKVGRHYFWSNFRVSSITLPKIKDMARAKREDLARHLGIDYDGNIYLNGNHCPAQPLRNCVHPLLGKSILNQARGIIEKSNTQQTELF